MGIDGIGKPPGGGTLPSGTDVGGAAKTGATFDVGRVEPTAAPVAGDSLSRLSRGEITLNQYLDDRVSQATEPYQGTLSADQLQFVQSTLREQIATDPVLVELVHRATGQMPKPE